MYRGNSIYDNKYIVPLLWQVIAHSSSKYLINLFFGQKIKLFQNFMFKIKTRNIYLFLFQFTLVQILN